MLNIFKKTAVMFLGFALVTGSVLADTAPKPISIPAGDLHAALQALIQQTGVQLMYDQEKVEGVHTGGVRDAKTAESAVVVLLKGTPLKSKVDASGAILIVAPVQTSGVMVQVPSAITEEQPKPNGEVEQPSEEIVVTATRRAERIRDVPLSITAITAQDIERRGLFNAADYLRGVPGTNQVESGPFGQSIVIRGIETSPDVQNFASGTTTATYFGETPTTSSAGMAGNSNVDIKLVDIERVEVLRGPQGTGFGSSSLGGAVRTIPVMPKLNRTEGKVAASYSSTSGKGADNYNAHLIGNLPLLGDKLAVRAVAYKYEDSGFYSNRAGSSTAFRATLPAGAEAFAVDDDEVGSYEVTGGRIAVLLQATEDLQFSASYLKQKSETDGIPFANSGTYEQTLLQVAPQQVRRGQKGGFYDMDISLANATMEYSFGWANVLATYSHVKSEAANAFAFGYLGNGLAASGNAFSEHAENVSEVRLATQLSGAWDFLVGLYYEDVDDGDDQQPFQTFYWLGSPATNIFNPNGSPLVGEATDTRNLKQKAAFGEVSWRFLPDWTLIAGARTYDYDRTRHFVSSGPLAGTANWTNDASASGNTYRASLSYKPTENALVYGGWSQGFRLGRPQNPLPVSLCDRAPQDGIIDGTGNTIDSTGTLNSDEVDSYEVGGKFAVMNQRLSIDAAVFRMDWSNMPAQLTAPSPPVGCALNYLLNAGSARSEGVEFQANFQISEPLRMTFGGSWIDATLTENLPGTTNTAGNRLAGSPRVNANLGLEYEFQLVGRKTSLRADSVYIGDFFGSVLENARSKAGEYIKLDVSARMEFKDLSVDLFVRNLTNEDAFSYRRDTAGGVFYGSRLRPRTVGLQINFGL